MNHPFELPQHMFWLRNKIFFKITHSHLQAWLITVIAWMKVFRIIPEFRILRLTFHTLSIERQPQNAELGRLSELL